MYATTQDRRRIAGQVQAIERMVDADRYCVELMHQIDAVKAAIGKAGEVVFRSHLQTSATDSIRNGDECEWKRTVEELVTVFGRYRRIRECCVTRELEGER